MKGHKKGRGQHRLLWLTDTYDDHNGVSMVLKSMHDEIKRRDLPVDIMVCSDSIELDDHLIIVRPVTEFNLPSYRQQPIRIPNILEIRKRFMEGQYDRIICSTEGPMGMMGLYLKRMFSVKTFFYLHTDWIMYASEVMNMEKTGLRRVRRLLRFFYKRYDGIFVLNTEQQGWLSGRDMNIDASRVFLTAHWVDSVFQPRADRRFDIFGIPPQTPLLLFAGRISLEKGVMELPALYQHIKDKIPDLRLVIAGTGPAESDLRIALPEALFLGWVDHIKLPEIYSSADILVLPSRFDTFSCVVLEAISCGLPVIAYESKGPKDILQHNVSGYLVRDADEMSQCIISYFSDRTLHPEFKNASLKRAATYEPDKILSKFMTNIGLRNAG